MTTETPETTGLEADDLRLEIDDLRTQIERQGILITALSDLIGVMSERTLAMSSLLDEYADSVRTVIEHIGPAVEILCQSPIMRMLGGTKRVKGSTHE